MLGRFFKQTISCFAAAAAAAAAAAVVVVVVVNLTNFLRCTVGDSFCAAFQHQRPKQSNFFPKMIQIR